MKQFVIGKNDANQRIDKFITKSIPTLPQSLLYKYIRTKRIKLNGKRCQISNRLNVADVVDFYINDEFFPSEEDSLSFMNAPTALNILYEDQNILLIDKQPGLIVHADDLEKNDTLINRILHYLHHQGEYDPSAEHSFSPSLVNRIDRNTGGIVIAAKNADTLRVLNDKMKNRELSKRYLCIVCGEMEKESAVLTGYLRKNNTENTVKIFDHPIGGGRSIRTKYQVLATKNNFSLVEIDLLTGRTHQIRAHMAWVGHPLLGDGKYGLGTVNRATGYKHQALYSYQLTFEFSSDAEHLAYLDKKTFKVQDVWFLKEFYRGIDFFKK